MDFGNILCGILVPILDTILTFFEIFFPPGANFLYPVFSGWLDGLGCI